LRASGEQLDLLRAIPGLYQSYAALRVPTPRLPIGATVPKQADSSDPNRFMLVHCIVALRMKLLKNVEKCRKIIKNLAVLPTLASL
jgi:hypothetical protein